MILAHTRPQFVQSQPAPAAGLFGYSRADLARARCPYAADPQKFAELFVETCTCALHRALRIAPPKPF